MADLQMDNEANPTAPSSGATVVFVNSTNKELTTVDDAANVKTIRPLTNAGSSDQIVNAADTYLTGSNISIPTQLVRVGSTFIWRFGMSKTGAGTGTTVWSVRFGTAGSTADTARLTFTNVAQTANADTGWAEIHVVVRTASATGVIEGVHVLTHVGSAATQLTGLINQPTDVKQTTSGAFDTTVASSIIGVSCNPGASGSWTFTHVSVQSFNL